MNMKNQSLAGHKGRFFFDPLILDDIENNSFAEIVESCYIACINRKIKEDSRVVPNFYEISDECLEFVCDNAIKTVTWNGVRIHAMTALDLCLRDVLIDRGLIFEENKRLINPYQIVMFEDLYD